MGCLFIVRHQTSTDFLKYHRKTEPNYWDDVRNVVGLMNQNLNRISLIFKIGRHTQSECITLRFLFNLYLPIEILNQ